MNIGIVNTCVPFVFGGAEVLAENLKCKLDEYGFKSSVVRLPFAWGSTQMLDEQMLAYRFLKFDMFDRLIVLKYPTYYIPHANKVLWLLHQFRQAYDLWESPFACIPKTPKGLHTRDIIIRADQKHISGISARYCISKVIVERLKKYNQIDSDVLYPPLLGSESYFCDESDDYIFFPSRLSKTKRQKLAIESMKYTRSNVKLILAGSPDTANDLTELQDYIAENGLAPKVKLISQWITHEEKVSLFSKSIGVLFIPFDEDYGYVTLEAYASKKPLITCLDSGGPLEFVENGINGYAVEPSPESLAGAMDRLYLDKLKAKRLGDAGWESLKTKNISWDHVIGRLTQ